jgi:cysteinyl-tRNA synthetase, unknown class
VSSTRFTAIAGALAVLACMLGVARPTCAQPQPAEPTAQSALAAAKSWGYQLQNVDPREIAAAPYDMLVIDYSRDGTDAEALTAQEVGKLKVKPDGARRIVLAYLSIGEAETYRYYWRRYWGWLFFFAPEWRGRQNTEWRGNYGVRYWQDDWQKIIFSGDDSYLERIIRAGFDGVYLDKVDEYVDMARENPDARAQMIALVKALAQRSRVLRPGFLIVPQNGEGLVTDAGYRAVIDGLGKEDLLFGEDKEGRPNELQSIRDNVARLKLLTADHKPVFAVEYLNAPQEIAQARQQLIDYGFIPYFADRALDRMRIGDLPDPGRKPGKK